MRGQEDLDWCRILTVTEITGCMLLSRIMIGPKHVSYSAGANTTVRELWFESVRSSLRIRFRIMVKLMSLEKEISSRKNVEVDRQRLKMTGLQ